MQIMKKSQAGEKPEEQISDLVRQLEKANPGDVSGQAANLLATAFCLTGLRAAAAKVRGNRAAGLADKIAALHSSSSSSSTKRKVLKKAHKHTVKKPSQACTDLLGASAVLKQVRKAALVARAKHSGALAEKLVNLLDKGVPGDEEAQAATLLSAAGIVKQVREAAEVEHDAEDAEGITKELYEDIHAALGADFSQNGDGETVVKSNSEGHESNQLLGVFANSACLRHVKLAAADTSSTHAEALGAKLKALVDSSPAKDAEVETVNVLAALAAVGKVRAAAASARGRQADSLAADLATLSARLREHESSDDPEHHTANLLAASRVVRRVRDAAAKARGNHAETLAIKLVGLLDQEHPGDEAQAAAVLAAAAVITQVEDAVAEESTEEQKERKDALADVKKGDGTFETDMSLFEEHMELLLDHGSPDLGAKSANLMVASGVMKRVKARAAAVRHARADRLAAKLGTLVESNTADDKEVETVNVLAALAAVGKVRSSEGAYVGDGNEHHEADLLADQLSSLVSHVDSKDPNMKAANMLVASKVVTRVHKVAAGARGHHAGLLADKLSSLLITVDPNNHEAQVANVLASVSMLGQVRKAASLAKGAHADKLALNLQQLVHTSTPGRVEVSSVKQAPCANILVASGVVNQVRDVAHRAKSKRANKQAMKLQALLGANVSTRTLTVEKDACHTGAGVALEKQSVVNTLLASSALGRVHAAAASTRGKHANSKAQKLASLLQRSKEGDAAATNQLLNLMAASTLMKQVQTKVKEAKGRRANALASRLATIGEEQEFNEILGDERDALNKEMVVMFNQPLNDSNGSEEVEAHPVQVVAKSKRKHTRKKKKHTIHSRQKPSDSTKKHKKKRVD